MQGKSIIRKSVKAGLCILLFIVLVQGVFAEETVMVLTKWGTVGTGNGEFSDASGIAVDSSGNMYVADTGNNRIQKFSSTGTFMNKWGTRGIGDGQFKSPSAIAVDSSGNVYVADSSNHRIQKFSSTGAFLSKWGGLDVVPGGKEIRSGNGDGQFNAPRGITTDSSGNVYVADTLNHRIQKFTSDGTFMSKWGSYGKGNGQFNTPYGVAVDSSGNVYVADNLNNRIQKFSSTGTFSGSWGIYGKGNGQFFNPLGITVDSSGIVYVADTKNSRIQKISQNGAFLGAWGSLIERDGLKLGEPNDIKVDSSGNVYIVEDFGVQKFVIQTSTPTQTPSITTRQPTRLATAPTPSQTTIKIPSSTPTPDNNANIAAVENQLGEQIQKIDVQGNILDQITTFLRNIFGWK
jgi:sugar lactone lactonase YvrE